MKAIVATKKSGEVVWHEQQCEVKKPVKNQCLVQIYSSSVNPVDYKVAHKLAEGETSRILGWDAVGKVVDTGPDVAPGLLNQKVWYLGALAADGCQADYQLVDADLLVLAPKTLSANQAASLPLTGLTALELLIDKLHYLPYPCDENSQRPMLLINGAGGVGSILLQLCRLWHIPVTATASRIESQQWCLAQGAISVIKHADIFTAKSSQYATVVCAHDTDLYFSEMIRLVAPFGKIMALSGTQKAQPIQLLMEKSVSFGFEFVFTRGGFGSTEKARQRQLLSMLTELADCGSIMATTTQILAELSAKNLALAHQQLHLQKMIGKLVITHQIEENYGSNLTVSCSNG